MWDWKKTAKPALEVMLFLTGAFGTIFFVWLHNEIVSTSAKDFGIACTVLTGLILIILLRKLAMS